MMLTGRKTSFIHSKLDAFAESDVTKNLKVVVERVENMEGKGYQHFLLFPQSFRKLSFSGLFKVSCNTGLNAEN